MKLQRIISLLIAAAAVLMFPTGFRADELKSYDIEEADVTVKLPAEMEVLTRATDGNSSLFEKHKTSKDNLLSGNIYLQGFSTDESQVFTLTVNQDSNSKNVYNYSLLSDKQIDSIQETYVKADSCKGCTIDKYDGVIYFTSFVNQKDENGKTSYLEQTDTVVNGKYVHFVLQSQDGELDNADKEFMKKILENIKFRIKPHAEADKNVLYLIWGTVGVLGIIIIVLFFSMIFRKKRRKKALKKINDRMYNRDSEHRKQVEQRRQNRKTAMGAERPDAFFDGVDGFETSKSMDRLERKLLREAHAQYDEQKRQEAEEEFSETEEISRKRKPRKRDAKKGRSTKRKL